MSKDGTDTIDNTNEELLAVGSGVPADLAPNNLLDDDGFEDVDAGDVQIPYIKMLQSNSPEVKKKGSEYVDGAEEGMIYDAGSGELIDGDRGMVIIPVFLEKVTVEWEPRDEGGGGGGFVARHPWDHPEIARQKADNVPPNKYVSAAGNKLAQTYYLWVMIWNPEEPDVFTRFGIVSFTSTNIAVFKKWMTKAKQATEMAGDRRRQVPLWRLLLRLGTQYTQNAKGEFFKYTVNFANAQTGEACGWRDSVIPEDDDRTTAALAFRQAIKTGGVAAQEPDASGSGQSDSNLDEDGAPF